MSPENSNAGGDVTPIPVRHDESSTPDPDTGTYRFKPRDPLRESDPDGIMAPLVVPRKIKTPEGK